MKTLSEVKIGAAGANQVTEEYTFDPQTGLLTNQTATKNGTTELLDLSYEYNRLGSVGNLSGKTGSLTKIIDNLNTAKNREYEFDALGRLTRAKGGATGTLWQQDYTYDRYGNRTNVAATGTAADSSPIPLDGVPNLAYDNATNRITTTGYEYDAAGNQIKAPDASGNGLLLEYDAANRIHIIKKESDSSYVQAFQYGSTNARVMDMDYGYGYLKIFASTGGTTLAEYTEYAYTVPTWTKSYTYFGDTQLSTITPNGTGGEFTEFNHPDRLSTRLITNDAGSYEQTHLPFGTALNAESTGSTANRFTTYDRSSPTGMDYAINRTYDPKQGRFTQVDPLAMKSISLEVPQTLNLYNYCGNDPVNRSDPDGLFFGRIFKWLGKVFKAIGRVILAVTQAINLVLNNRWLRLGIFILGFVLPILGPLAGIVTKAIRAYNYVANLLSSIEMTGQILTGRIAELGLTLGMAFIGAIVSPLIDGVMQGVQNKLFGLGGFGSAVREGWHQFKNKLSSLKTVLIGLTPFMGPDVPADAEHESRYASDNYGDDPLDAGQAAARKHDRALIDAKDKLKRGIIDRGEYLRLRRSAHGSLVKGLTRGTRLRVSDIVFGGRPSSGAVYSFIGIGYFSASWSYLRVGGN